MSGGFEFGINLWSQGGDWQEVVRAGRRIDELGYDSLWTWDHLNAIVGDPYQPIFEGWTMLAGLAGVTRRVELGLMVGANTFRNPGLTAKIATTLDHVSGGRARLGIGAAWFELEHRAHGIDFGSSVGERLDWLDEAVAAMRKLLDGQPVTSSPGGRYHFDDLRHSPLPLQTHLPIMIGGGGERKTLRTVAKYADGSNLDGSPATLHHKSEVLEQHCADVGRDSAEIQRTIGCRLVIRDDPKDARRVFEEQMAANRRDPARELEEEPELWWLGPPRMIAERILASVPDGFSALIAELPAPYDTETIERLIGEVKPLVAAG